MRNSLEMEAAKRQYLDDENRRLRDELLRLKGSDPLSTTASNSSTDFYQVKRQHISSTLSHSNGFDRELGRNASMSAASSTLVQRLTHENAELRRDSAAQMSMLTSRNREKASLYQEIEELKLGLRRGDGSRSVAGDSIFERSASRAHRRSASRTSQFTTGTRISDNERELLEAKNGELRDLNSALKLKYQELELQLDPLLDELEQADKLKLDHDKLLQDYDETFQDLQTMQSERDEALKHHELLEAEMQDYKSQAQNYINTLEEDLDQKCQYLQRLEADMSNEAEQTEALKKEVQSLDERIRKSEEELWKKGKLLEDLENENVTNAREIEAVVKVYHEEIKKNEKLTVQQESSQTEIKFLREDQEVHVMKIGDLENTVSNLENNLESERERTKDLDARLAEERHQREVIGSKEKQEVQKIMNNLNREVSDAKEESRKLKQNLQSSEIEATAIRERLVELESNLREALGDSNGTRSSFLTVSFPHKFRELH